MVFANQLLPSRDYITGDKTRRATAVNKITIPGLMTCNLANLYRETHITQSALYLDGKNHAVPSLHRAVAASLFDAMKELDQ